MIKRSRSLVALLVASSLVAAACGGDDDDVPAAEEPAAEEPAAEEPAAEEPAAEEPAAEEPSGEVTTDFGVDAENKVIYVGLNADLSGPFASLVSEIVASQEVYWDVFNEAGFTVDRVRPVTPFSPRTRMFSVLSGGRYDHLFMTQISIEAHRR